MRTGMDIARFTAAAYDVPGLAAWLARVGGRYVLTTGGLAPENGVLDLLEAHATLLLEQAALADVRMVVAGRQPDADEDLVAELTRRAAELGTAPILLGPVTEAEFPALVAGASAFGYLPTRDASCVSAIEALAAGVPVIARDLPEVRAVLRDVVAYGDTVLSIADALVDVLTDPPEPDAGVALAAAYAEEGA
ncbi:glycosyltransferase [Nocardioides bizhenqiangii]|uniref:Glycosyltransferase n=1 Tax=Nocardioides bizhenqiangii TaxID=3095076 RepID=A0ABZ0ZV65_9ACTN|nr:glycosyltransferase [Nocardioides sp. HM61]WQQ28128.1 glycosyltransferase [Nocardioides sp. HM61]